MLWSADDKKNKCIFFLIFRHMYTYISKKIDVVKEYYQISRREAKDYVELLSDTQIRQLKNSMKTGGKDNG